MIVCMCSFRDLYVIELFVDLYAAAPAMTANVSDGDNNDNN